jgi:replicative DNA helicase
MTSFEKFGNHFQLRLFHFLITDKDFAAAVLEILSPEFFTNEHYQTLMTFISSYYDKYHTMPSFDNLETIIATELTDEVEIEYLQDTLKKIAADNNKSDKDFIEEKATEFCKQQAMVKAIKDCVPLIQRESYEEIYSIIQTAINAGTSRDDGHDYFEMAMTRLMDERSPIPTGLDLLDRHLSGGLGAGELGIILAGTGVGKSMMLVYLAGEAIKRGLNVVYYTLEMAEYMVGIRLDAKLTKIPLSNLLSDSKGEYRTTVAKQLKTIRDRTGNDVKFTIKEYPTKSASITTIRNHLMRMRNKGFVPDMIIVDYADIMKPVSIYKEKRYELESNIEQLRAVAGEMGVPVWTASQTNREGLDSSVVGLKAISESLAKAMVADAIISVGRDAALQESGEACYYLAKNRFGNDKIIFTGQFDTSTLNFTVDREGLEADSLDRAATVARDNTVRDRVRELFESGGTSGSV